MPTCNMRSLLKLSGVAKNRSQVSWSGDLTVQNIDRMDPLMRRAMVAVAGRTAPQAEAWMKSNARWVDQTANARNGLGARSVVSPRKVAIVLYHSVPYGFWLEVRWDGRYAVIEPAIREFAPRVMAMVARLAFRKGT